MAKVEKDDDGTKKVTRIGFTTPERKPDSKVPDPAKKDGPLPAAEGRHLFGKM
jgi:hypothetical protein